MSRSVRLKEHLAAEVERLAKEERRSLAQMVELLLEQALAAESIALGREREMPATGKPRAAIEHPADGTWSPPIGDDHFKPDFKGGK